MKTANDFIKIFKSIPESRWCVGAFNNHQGQHCAVGLLNEVFGANFFIQMHVNSLFRNFIERSIVTVNDDYFHECLGDTPKERILIQLENIKGAGG